MVLKRLMDEFSDNAELMKLVSKWYDLQAEWDKLTIKKVQLLDIRNEKIALLQGLQSEYAKLNDGDASARGRNLDKKLALGQKIASLKLELDKSVEQALKSIEDRLLAICDERRVVNGEISNLQDETFEKQSILGKIQGEISDMRSKLNVVTDLVQADIDQMRNDIGSSSSSYSSDGSTFLASDESTLALDESTLANESTDENDEDDDDNGINLNTDRLHRLVIQSERWRNYSFNMGYELSQFKKMLTMCEDATIKVRRLLHNFEEKIKDTQEQVWDENFNLRPEFNFKDISVSSLQDIILLHDWWAANAGNVAPEGMKMTDEQFMEFRKRCNKISYNLRKNQYAQLLSVRIDRTEKRISEIEDAIKDTDTLQWDDKYGWEAERDEGEGKWNLDKASSSAKQRVRLVSMAQNVIGENEADARRYEEDSKKLASRTINYLKNLGLIETEQDLERLALASASRQNPEESQRWMDEIQRKREELDSAIGLMKSERKSIQGILDNVAKMEGKIQELEQKNKRIFDICMKSGKKVKGVTRQVRNRMLMDKLDNEQRIMELKSLIKKAKSQHLEDFSALEKMRKDVDEKQSTYDQKVREFKTDIGLTTDVVNNLMVGIYNKFQDEILEHDKMRRQK
jgi:hypothetical protein